MLTDEIRTLIENHSAGMVATVNSDGTPSVSPKATFLILTNDQLAFSNIRSPHTIKNLIDRPAIEICFIDVVLRKSARITGSAHYVEKNEAGPELIGKFKEIFGDYLEYDRKNLILMVEGNVKILDLLNNTKINAKKIVYYKKEEKIITLGEALIETDNNFLIKTKNLTYLKKETKIKSNEFTSINDKLGNVLTVSKFVYLIPDKIINGSSINYSDLQSNKYFIEQGVYDLNSRNVIGKDLEINFDRSSFGNSTNQPRLKGRSIYVDENVRMNNLVFRSEYGSSIVVYPMILYSQLQLA